MANWAEVFTIGHVLGVVVGMGSALVSDAIFFKSIKDGRISETEMKFIRLGSRMVWVGLAIILIFGLLLVSTNTDKYFASHKFWAKMTIVAILILNGIAFHFSHIPRIVRHVGEHFPSSDEFIRKRPLLIISGAISSVSWLSAFILGSLRSTPFSYAEIISFYTLILILSISSGLILQNRIMPDHRNRDGS